MTAPTVPAKRQVAPRKDVVNHRGVRAPRLTGHVSQVFGLLKREGGPAVSIEEMNETITQGWAGEG